MEEKMISRSLGIHDGPFHADEVCAAALLCLYDLIDEDKIYRTRDDTVLQKCEYVGDVGGIYDIKSKRFDHHQLSYQGDLSSAGMVLHYLKEKGYMKKSCYDFFNRSLIMGVDAFDNGNVTLNEGDCSFSEVIANFLPIEYDASPSELMEAFYVALDFTLNFLKRLKKRFEYLQDCKEVVKEEMKKNQIVLFFDQAIPWEENFFDLGGEDHPAKFLIMPTAKYWKLRAIPPSWQDRMNVRTPLPKEWAGLQEKELQQKTQIPGAIFCHKGRFISIWKTKEDAMKALKIVLENKGVVS